MLRTIGFGLLALLVFMVCVELGDVLSEHMAPPPGGMNVHDPASIAAHMSEIPVLAFVVMIVAHLIGALLGGWIVGRSTGNMAAALIVAGLMLIAGVTNLAMLPHPTWFWLDAFVYVPAALLGFRLGRAPGGI